MRQPKRLQPHQRTAVGAWLMSSRITDTPEGDLIADMKAEWRRGAEMPDLFSNIEDMRGYLRRHGPCPEALAVVPGVWRRYCNWLDQHGMSWSEVFYKLDPKLESLSDP